MRNPGVGAGLSTTGPIGPAGADEATFAVRGSHYGGGVTASDAPADNPRRYETGVKMANTAP